MIVPVLKSLRGLLHSGEWVTLTGLEAEDGSFYDNQTPDGGCQPSSCVRSASGIKKRS